MSNEFKNNEISASNDAISELTDCDTVRKRPEVYYQDRGSYALFHQVNEVFTNAVDEIANGRGDKITLTRYADNSVSIEDNCGGLPLDYNNKTGKYNYETMFFKLFGGGKYNNESYTVSGGFNGLGLTIVNYASEFMKVRSVRNEGDGKRYLYEIEFKQDKITKPFTKTETTLPLGTKLHWRGDLAVFTHAETNEISSELLHSLCKGVALLFDHIEIVFIDELKEREFIYKGQDKKEFLMDKYGEDLIGDLLPLKASGVTCDTQRLKDNQNYTFSIEGYLGFKRESLGNTYFYHNMIKAVRGVHAEAFTTAFENIVCKELNDPRLISCVSNFILFVATTSSETSASGQAKEFIKNPGLKKELIVVYSNALRILLGNKAFIKHLKEVQKNFVALETKKKKIVESISNVIDTATKDASKEMAMEIATFADCDNLNGYSEITFTEGLSAFGPCKDSRDYRYQAIKALRGKIKNLSKDVLSLLESPIIIDIIRTLKCGIDETIYNMLMEHAATDLDRAKLSNVIGKFDISKIKYNKVIIATDGDKDGEHIRVLFIGLIYLLMPELLRRGLVYICESPLYEFEFNDGSESVFAYTEDEKKELQQKYAKNKYKINRSKGLGENDQAMMIKTTMDPKTRKLLKVEFSDTEGQLEIIDITLGNDANKRKDLIIDYVASAYAEDADAILEILKEVS